MRYLGAEIRESQTLQYKYISEWIAIETGTLSSLQPTICITYVTELQSIIGLEINTTVMGSSAYKHGGEGCVEEAYTLNSLGTWLCLSIWKHAKLCWPPLILQIFFCRKSLSTVILQFSKSLPCCCHYVKLFVLLLLSLMNAMQLLYHL